MLALGVDDGRALALGVGADEGRVLTLGVGDGRALASGDVRRFVSASRWCRPSVWPRG